jgi:DNA-binding NtrC family response regulator
MESTMNILILDDDQSVGQSLSALLTLDGHAVVYIEDPRDVDDFETRQIALLICDFQFGEVTAAYVLRLPGFEQISQRILISGHDRSEIPHMVLTQFSDFIHKLDATAVSRRIRSVSDAASVRDRNVS